MIQIASKEFLYFLKKIESIILQLFSLAILSTSSGEDAWFNNVSFRTLPQLLDMGPEPVSLDLITKDA
jgi:hypothetical protein